MTKRSLALLLALASCMDPASGENEAPISLAAGGGGTGCRQTSGPIYHGTSIASDQFWAGYTTHVLPNGINLTHTLTIGPCALVQIGAGQTISVSSGGALVTQTDPNFGFGVTFGRLDPNNAWAQIHGLGGSLSLTHATITGGGAGPTPHKAAALVVEQGSRLIAQGLTIAGSATDGLRLRNGGVIDPSTSGLSIYSSAGAPVFTDANLAWMVPTASAYTGNGDDEIVIPVVANGFTVTTTQTWADHGIPYRIGDGNGSGALRVASGNASNVAVLTLVRGLTLRFEPGNVMLVETASIDTAATGALVAVGTPTSPILFTSTQPVPARGDWQGIWFNGAVDPRSQIKYAGVEFAGGPDPAQTQSFSCLFPSGVFANFAAIRMLSRTPPPNGVFITATSILHSLHHGIDRGFITAAPGMYDFVTPNGFSDVIDCNQTFPQGSVNGCMSCK